MPMNPLANHQTRSVTSRDKSRSFASRRKASRRGWCLLAVLVQIAACGSIHAAALAAEADSSTNSLAARVDSLLGPQIKPGGPGCSVAVVKDGTILFERGYGLANLDWDIPNTPATVFNLASLSKQFTAACVVLLAEQGKLSLDDDIRIWLPEVRDYGKKITIRNLLHHTSGIRDYESLMPPAGLRYDVAWKPGEIFEFITRQRELDFAPGEKFSYSNSGYVLLAEIIRKASGLTLARFAEQRIFKPLGMRKSFFYDDLYQVVKNRATGYDYDFDRGVYSTGQNDIYTTGPGGVFSTVQDLAVWERNFCSNRLGGPQFLKTLLTPGVRNNGETLKYACGLEIGNYRGLPTLSHSGWWAGFLSYMLRFPDQKTTIFLLANSTSDVLPVKYCRKLADLYLRDQFPPEHRPVPTAPGQPPVQRAEKSVNPALYDRYAGTYQIGELDMVFTVSRDGDRLLGQFKGQFRFQMYPASDNTFFLKIDEAEVKFLEDKSGQVDRLLWCQGGQENPFTRITPQWTPEQLRAYCGKYRSEDLQTTWSLVSEGGWLKVRSPMKSSDLAGNDLLLRKKGELFCLSDMTLEFNRDSQGQVTGFELNRAGATWRIPFTRE
jgi:CubicO group peptidase (beta-lactamase class C family)